MALRKDTNRNYFKMLTHTNSIFLGRQHDARLFLYWINSEMTDLCLVLIFEEFSKFFSCHIPEHLVEENSEKSGIIETKTSQFEKRKKCPFFFKLIQGMNESTEKLKKNIALELSAISRRNAKEQYSRRLTSTA